MVTRNIVLTDHQAAFLDGLVASGSYQNVSEAMRAGLRLLEREEAEWQANRARILESLAQVERGEVVEGDIHDLFNRAFARAGAIDDDEGDA